MVDSISPGASAAISASPAPLPILERDLAHTAGAGALKLSGAQVYSLLDAFRTCWSKEKSAFDATL